MQCMTVTSMLMPYWSAVRELTVGAAAAGGKVSGCVSRSGCIWRAYWMA